ncbi:WD40 repeat-like protein [Periconia macrospinosa]|uniref:WD40 repeat-like protein n=1 Tax=Periconia macrospinosa TaxID=97972 RepID=A0A2V1DQ42_9PLEO|nr:WD40 repeat-like protein [Periconia macrospinosa]
MANVLPKIKVMDSSQIPTLQRQDTGGKGKGGGKHEVLPPTNGKIAAKLRSPISSGPTTSAEATGSVNGKKSSEEYASEAGIDPLSQHILKRTNTSNLQRYRSQTIDSPGQTPGSPNDTHTHTDTKGDAAKEANSANKADKKKGVSFLSRFIGNKKKTAVDETEDNGSELEESRPEGMDATLFAHSGDNLGFHPRYPQPPAYIKVRTKFKKEKEFNHLFLAQELQSGTKKRNAPAVGANPAPQSGSAGSQNPVWATEFSQDGKYLAAGGQDRVVRVWAVISTPEERRAHELEESSKLAEGQNTHLSAPVFQQKPFRLYIGHESTILDLSWSKNNFLLSSSMDKTVRLWHLSRSENLCTFKHSDIVPSIQFHPRDDRFFLAGSLDTKLRLWSIPDKSVAFSASVSDMVTAVSFTPDGKSCIAGTLSGLCMFYETEGLKYQSQIHVKSTRGQNAKGSKITGIQIKTFPVGRDREEMKLLVTSNDSRIRVYNLRDKSLEMKFKAHENNSSQIRATFADDTSHIICGSEDRKAYIWSTFVPESERRNQHPVELFEAHSAATTCALLAPLKTRLLLAASEDPIFDLCNPPPVTLISREPSINGSKPTTETGSNLATPIDSTFTKVAGSPAYIARSEHPDGNIIITTDFTGSIKVFRQDCAYTKRMRFDTWDTSSVFSKRTGSKISISRTGSLKSRSGRSRRDSTSTQPPNERIMSWRQELSQGGSGGAGGFDALNGSNTPRASMTRSSSPRKRASRISMISMASASNSPRLEPQVLSEETMPNLDLTAEKPRPLSLSSAPLNFRDSWSLNPPTTNIPTTIVTPPISPFLPTPSTPSPRSLQPQPSNLSTQNAHASASASASADDHDHHPTTPLFDPISPQNLTRYPSLSNPLCVYAGQSWAFWSANRMLLGLLDGRERERERDKERVGSVGSVGTEVSVLTLECVDENGEGEGESGG